MCIYEVALNIIQIHNILHKIFVNIHSKKPRHIFQSRSMTKKVKTYKNCELDGQQKNVNYLK